MNLEIYQILPHLAALSWVTTPTWIILVALVILPNLPVPNSLTVLFGGCTLASRYGTTTAILLTLFCFCLAFIWAYVLLKFYYPEKFHLWISKKFPINITIGNSWRAVFAIRLLPGCPLFAQTFLLCFLKTKFATYLFGSIACQLITVPIIIIGGFQALQYITHPITIVILLAAIIVLITWHTKIKSTT